MALKCFKSGVQTGFSLVLRNAYQLEWSRSQSAKVQSASMWVMKTSAHLHSRTYVRRARPYTWIVLICMGVMPGKHDTNIPL